MGLEPGTAGLQVQYTSRLAMLPPYLMPSSLLRSQADIGQFVGEFVNIRYHLGIFSGCPVTIVSGTHIQRYQTHMVAS